VQDHATSSYEPYELNLYTTKNRPTQRHKVTIETIQHEVSAYFDVKLRDLKGQGRHQAVARPRMVAVYLSRKLTGTSFPKIGKHFGGRDHSTVMSAVRKIERLLAQDSRLRDVVNILEGHLRLLSVKTTPTFPLATDTVPIED
jgi:chromosomal replication initiation ATPase DnaA